MNAHRLLAAVAVTLGLASLPGQASAQGCNTCDDLCGVNAHLDWCGEADWGFSSGCIPNYCHFGSCTSVHYFDCGEFSDFTPAEIDHVVRAAQREDIDQLRVFILSSDQVFLHLDRSAVQIVGCGGEVIASVALSAVAFDNLRDLAPIVATRQPRGSYQERTAIAAAFPR
jgi:hypothetical protein